MSISGTQSGRRVLLPTVFRKRLLKIQTKTITNDMRVYLSRYVTILHLKSNVAGFKLVVKVLELCYTVPSCIVSLLYTHSGIINRSESNDGVSLIYLLFVIYFYLLILYDSI